MEEKTSMPSSKFHLNAPGLKPRGKNAERLYWAARADIAKAGYTPRLVRLHYDIHDPADHRLIEAACQRLDAEMKAWASGHKRSVPFFDGTVLALSRRYQTDPASPFLEHKWNWRDRETRILKTIEGAFGARSLASLGNTDFKRWYEAAKQPKKPGAKERIDRAVKIIKLLRQMVTFGAAAELPHCERLHGILSKMRFKGGARSRLKLERHHVEAFIPAAIDAGRLSLAFGTALQFETMMRQKDVIGEWEPFTSGAHDVELVLNGNRWVNGLMWTDISPSMVIKKDTTKTGATVVADLKLCPLVLQVLRLVPPDRRVGPLIIDENSGRPYAEDAYAREWRLIARSAGIPDEVKNMHARAGAISEADDALAPIEEIQSSAGHTQASTTRRYIRGTIGKSRHVAELRQLHRDRKQDENEK
ncbi:integrase [Bradyrhizobium sp. CW1]|uniref:integrase n=1 Tax=Bradyrhizobium sp. CW1 TaxID=2782686 RepID=UPI001FFF784E|nr:integrase [Bradyrhizobium sp. CW1]